MIRAKSEARRVDTGNTKSWIGHVQPPAGDREYFQGGTENEDRPALRGGCCRHGLDEIGTGHTFRQGRAGHPAAQDQGETIREDDVSCRIGAAEPKILPQANSMVEIRRDDQGREPHPSVDQPKNVRDGTLSVEGVDP